MVSFFRVIKFGVQNFWRNKWLSLATTVVMTLALLTVSLSVFLNLIIGITVQMVRERIDIEIFFDEDVTESQVFDVRNRLDSLDAVKSIEYISKEKALEIYKEKNKDNKDLDEPISLDENPLPMSLKVSLTDPEKISQINSFVKQNYNSLVSDISYQDYKEVINKLLSTTNSVKRAGFVLSLVFIVMSLVVVFNTIRITIFSRREEIEIMKLVGATNWFIRWPFIIEGLIYGVFASIFSISIVALASYFTMPALNHFFGNLSVDFFQEFNLQVPWVIVLQVALGVSVGVFSSLVAISKHLRV